MIIRRRSNNIVPYPKGLLLWTLRAPISLYHLGLGWLLGLTTFMVLTTRGRKSGLPRHVVLEFRRHGSRYYVVSGWGTRPQWYQNLLADPYVTIQHGRQTLRARAVPVNDPAEALRAVHLFSRSTRVHDILLSSMSTETAINLRTLTEVADEFTVVRLQIEQGDPPLAGVERRVHWGLPLALLGLPLIWLLLRLITHEQEAN